MNPFLLGAVKLVRVRIFIEKGREEAEEQRINKLFKSLPAPSQVVKAFS